MRGAHPRHCCVLVYPSSVSVFTGSPPVSVRYETRVSRLRKFDGPRDRLFIFANQDCFVRVDFRLTFTFQRRETSHD